MPNQDDRRRRLAAILAADVAGYSRLMGQDENATITALNACRAIFRDRIDSHRGRVVDTAGDSVLAVFDSVVEAVQCANEVQAELGTRNQDLPDDRRMLFRIGVNLGDVIEQDDGTIYGDGVNVAARLESLAEPGSICLSGSAHEQVEGKTDLGFQYIGEHKVKNIAKPVRAYQVLTDGSAATIPSSASVISGKRAGLIVAASVAVLIAGFGAWWLTRDAPTPMLTAAGIPTDDPVLAMPIGPSIAVLPFDNLTGDPGQDYFADGITEEIITGLARFSNLRVLARNSSFQFKGQAIDVAEIGRRLNVDYVVEGSVRRAASTVRVTAQLLDASDGAHIWAETYDRELTAESLFAVQDDITSQVITRIGDIYGALNQAQIEKMRRAGKVDLRDYDCVLLAYEYQRFLTPDKHGPVRACLEETVERNPDYADGWANLAFTYVDQYWAGFEGPKNPLALAEPAARKAIELDPTSQIGHFALANVYYFLDDIDAFFIEAEKTLKLNPNNTEMIAGIGVRVTYAEKRQRGVALIEKATRLNPAHPGWYWFPVAFHHYRSKDYTTALGFARRIDMPGFWYSHLFLAAIYGQLGDKAGAQAAVSELNTLNPTFKDNPEKLLRMWFKSEEAVGQFIDGLEKAGLFDEAQAPTRPVIAVLPFTNMSGDPEQEYFADGITEDIITELTRYSSMDIIARNSTFQFKGKAVDVREVGELLGAQYVVEGSVRRSADTVRITAQMLDAADGTHLWAETYDRQLTPANIFAVQDEISGRIANLLGDVGGVVNRVALTVAKRQPAQSLSSYDCLLRAFAYGNHLTFEGYRTARACLQQVTETEPDYADAWAWRGSVEVDGHATWADLGPEAVDEGMGFAKRALHLQPNHQFARWTMAYGYFFQQKRDQFIDEANRAIAINPNNVAVVGRLGAFLASAGEWERGIELVNQSIELNPHYPAWINYALVSYFLRKGDYPQALDKAHDFSERAPNFFWGAATVALTLGLMGEFEEARKYADRVRELNPSFEANIRAESAKWMWGDDKVIELWVDGLRKAGMDVPDETAADD